MNFHLILNFHWGNHECKEFILNECNCWMFWEIFYESLLNKCHFVRSGGGGMFQIKF